MYSYLIFGITYAFAAAVQPGPFQTYIISQTLEKGWRATLPAVFAPVISDIPVLIVVLFLLSTMPDNFIVILRTGGGLFLIFLAFKAFKSWQNFGRILAQATNLQQMSLPGKHYLMLLS